MIDIEDTIINFHYIVKNRLGPYRIVLKNDDNSYLSAALIWTSKSYAYDYCPRATHTLFRDINRFSFDFVKIILTTRTDEIQLNKKDLNPKYFSETK